MDELIKTVKILKQNTSKDKKIENHGFRKSKAKDVLIDKIKIFWLIKVCVLFDLQSISDANLDQMILALNVEKITLQDSKEELQKRNLKIIEDSLTPEYLEDENLLNEEMQSYESLKDDLLKQENLYDQKIDKIDKKISVINEEQDLRSIDIEQDVNDVLEENLPEVEEEQEIDVPIDEIPNEEIIEKVQEEITTIDEPISPIEVKDTILDEITMEYEKNLNNIKDAFDKNFLVSFEELFSNFRKQADEYTQSVVKNIATAAKEAIEKANSNTEKAIIEKISVEQERDKLKNNFEQTLEIVSNRDKSISDLNSEITNLNSKIVSKEDEIVTKNKEIDALSKELFKKDEIISADQQNISGYQTAIATFLKTGIVKSPEKEEEVLESGQALTKM